MSVSKNKILPFHLGKKEKNSDFKNVIEVIYLNTAKKKKSLIYIYLYSTVALFICLIFSVS